MLKDVQLPERVFNSDKQCLKVCGRVLKQAGIYFYRTSTHIVLPDNTGFCILRDPTSQKARLLDLSNPEDQQVYSEVTKL